MSKECCWEEYSRRLDSNYLSANKVFWQTICLLLGKNLSTVTSIKDLTGNFLRDEKEILSRWKKYFEDLLNPVRATPTDKYAIRLILWKRKFSRRKKWQQPYDDWNPERLLVKTKSDLKCWRHWTEKEYVGWRCVRWRENLKNH